MAGDSLAGRKSGVCETIGVKTGFGWTGAYAAWRVAGPVEQVLKTGEAKAR